MRALYAAATGMAAQQTRVEVISNNLANMSTTGYNARRAEFADLAGVGPQSPIDDAVGLAEHRLGRVSGCDVRAGVDHRLPLQDAMVVAGVVQDGFMEGDEILVHGSPPLAGWGETWGRPGWPALIQRKDTGKAWIRPGPRLISGRPARRSARGPVRSEVFLRAANDGFVRDTIEAPKPAN